MKPKEQCIEAVHKAVQNYRMALHRDPGEIRLSLHDWSASVNPFETRGRMFGIPACADIKVEPGRIRLLCRPR